MKKIALLSINAMVLTGLTACAVSPIPKEEIKDKEPILVGIPINERVAITSNKINEQLDLLNKINSKKYIGKYEMVEHNNGLDARKGSSRTLPESFAKDENSIKLEQKIKKLEWENESANSLGKLLADSIGYTLVLNGTNDVKISLKAENKTVKNVVTQFSQVMSKNATVILVEKNKTLNIIYK